MITTFISSLITGLICFFIGYKFNKKTGLDRIYYYVDKKEKAYKDDKFNPFLTGYNWAIKDVKKQINKIKSFEDTTDG